MPPCLERLPQLRGAVEQGCGEHAATLERALQRVEQDAGVADEDTLTEEFKRLFCGPDGEAGLGTPSESSQRRRTGQWHEPQSVIDAYEEASVGLPVSSVTARDHIGLELKFMALLACREMQAWRDDNAACAIGWLQRERRFLDEHLLQWVPDYCAVLAHETRRDFYRGLAQLTSGMLVCERQHVASLLARSPESSAADAAC
jgi:TorA maturation chaperone TorD